MALMKVNKGEGAGYTLIKPNSVTNWRLDTINSYNHLQPG